MIILEDWYIVNNYSEEDMLYKAPEQLTKRLSGNVFGHSRFEDGYPVNTSTITELNLENGTAMTRNTLYHLGKPAPEFIKWYNEQTIEKVDLSKFKRLAEES